MINLACGENIKQSKVMNNALDTALEINKLVKKSPRREAKLQKLRQACGDNTESPNPNIRTLCPTRWTRHSKCTELRLSNGSTKMKARVRGVQTHN